jgi:hypothetical protein
VVRGRGIFFRCVTGGPGVSRVRISCQSPNAARSVSMAARRPSTTRRTSPRPQVAVSPRSEPRLHPRASPSLASRLARDPSLDYKYTGKGSWWPWSPTASPSGAPRPSCSTRLSCSLVRGQMAARNGTTNLMKLHSSGATSGQDSGPGPAWSVFYELAGGSTRDGFPRYRRTSGA